MSGLILILMPGQGNSRRRRVRIQYQFDTMDCAAACLSMIAGYFDCHVQRTKLSEMCKGTRNGVSCPTMKRVHGNVGIEGSAVRIPVEKIPEAVIPAILYWNGRHFVVLYGIVRKGRQKKMYYKVADPAFGYATFSSKEMAEHWYLNGENAGRLMFFRLSDSNTPALVRPDSNSDSGLRLLWKYFHRYKAALAKIGLCVLFVSILQLLIPFTTQAIVDIGIEQKDMRVIYIILLAQMMIIIGRAAGDFIRRWILLRISVLINLSLVSDFFSKLVKLPMRFFDSKKDGDLLQRINDHGTIESFITSKSLETVFSFFSLLIFSGVLFYYSPRIFLIFTAGSLLYGAWIILFLHKRKLLNYKFFNKRAKNQGDIYQMITGMEEMKLYSCVERKLAEWEAVQMDLMDLNMQSLKLEQRSEAGNLLINEGKNMLITAFAAASVIQGDITLGSMLSVQYIIGQLSFPVEQAANFIFNLQDVKISLDRINDVYSREEEITQHHTVPSSLPNGDIRIDGVCFSYEDSSRDPVINHLTLSIEREKTTAIVGTSGSGKTTLIKLLLKYYEPDSGTITIGDTDYLIFNPEWWREQCSVVMQDGFIFSDTIARNIAPSGEIDREKLIYSAQVANIHDTVMSLPLKYDTFIGMDGQGLSMGQRQRLLIARAVYKNAPLVFFDEATNSLDSGNEKSIVDNLSSFFKDKTVVIVAHRLSAVKNADKIVVMENGAIIESGTHSELIKKSGRYFSLIKNQLELGM